MELTFKVNTDDMFNCDEGIPFEDLFTDALKKELVAKVSTDLGKEHFRTFSQLTADATISTIKARMENFLNEDIALTDTWGKPIFIGSMEDLIKSRFDNILLRPVDSRGETLQACSSGKTTWIEWKINQKIDSEINNAIEKATSKLKTTIKNTINEKLKELTENTIKDKVSNVFSNIMNKE